MTTEMGGTLKQCSTCKETKPFAAFAKNKAMKDGYQNVCKSCQEKRREEQGIISKTEATRIHEELESSGQMFECRTCHTDKTAKHFYHQRKHGRFFLNTLRCKECECNLQRKKSFPTADYDKMLIEQNSECAICHVSDKEHLERFGKKFAIDHDHSDGRIRGLLCANCNRGIGYLQESEAIMLSAIEYLKVKI